MDKLICLIVSTAVMVGAQGAMFFRLSELRYDRRKLRLLTVALGAVVCAVSIGAAIPNDCDRDAVQSLLSLALPSVIYFFVISKYRGVRFFSTFCIAVVSISLVDFFAYLFGLMFYAGNYTVDWIVRAAAIAAWSVALRFLVDSRYRKALNLLQKGWWLMLLCAVSMYFLMCLISAYPTPIDQRIEDVPTAMLMVAMMGLTLIIILQVTYNTMEVKERQLREQDLESRLAMAERQYAILLENIDDLRKLRHDMKYHENVILGFLEEQNYEELRRYLEKGRSDLTALDMELPLYTRNQTANILAAHYARQAKAAGVRTEFTIQLPAELPIDRPHLTILLGNLWQNALEACKELPEEAERYIKTSIAVRQNKLMLQCVNTAANIRRDEDGQYVSTKGPGHGNGLNSVEDVVGLYGGFCEFNFDGHEFTCSAVLPLPADVGGER